MNIDVQIKKAKDGNDILEIVKNDRLYRLNSTYTPFMEAEKFAKQYADLEEDSILLVFGFGNGIFADAIMKACGKTTKVLFYEPCKEIIDCIEKSFDIFPFCNSWDCAIVADGFFQGQGDFIYAIAEFPKALQDIVLYHRRKRVHYCILPKYKELFPIEYKKYESTIKLHLEKMQAGIQTAKAIGHIAVENNIKLLKYIPDSYCADSFVDLFPENMPAILVSAGPSLEKNVKVLQQAKGKALILCVDTAVKYMLKENMLPDMIISIDPRKELSLFDDKRIHDIPLVGIADMSWKVLEQVQSRMFILASAENLYIQKLYAQAGHQLEELCGGGSVATAAYQFCHYLGFKRLILVGQDLALTDNQMYAGKQKLSMDTFNREIIEVEDVYGKPVYTTRDYYYYLKWFEQSVEMYPEMQVVDATEGGAKINGTLIMSLQEALNLYAKKEYDINALLDSVEPVYQQYDKASVVERILTDRKQYDAMILDLERGVSLANKAKRLVSRGTQHQVLKCARLNKEMYTICDKYQSSDMCFLVQREIDATDLENYIEIYETKKTESPEKQYESMQRYFECILKAARTVKSIYDKLEFK